MARKGIGTVLKAVTFDLWNTLIELHDPDQPHQLRVERVRAVLARFGCQAGWEEVSRQIKISWQKLLQLQYSHGLDFTPAQQVAAIVRHFGLHQNPEAEAELYRAYAETLLQLPPRVVDGADEMLTEVSSRFALGLICNTGSTPGYVLRDFLERVGLARHFRTMTFSDELGVAKPNPLIFNHTLQLLAAEAGEALHIGDDPLTDIRGALAAGIRAIWVCPADEQPFPVHTRSLELPPLQLLVPPETARVRRLGEIPQLLEAVAG